MRFCWPENTTFQNLVLDVERDYCDDCGRRLYICDHRIRHIYTLEHPLELCCRLAHCSDPTCPSRPRTFSPLSRRNRNHVQWLQRLHPRLAQPTVVTPVLSISFTPLPAGEVG